MLNSARLKELRQRHGYTHQTLAGALGLSAKQVWRYEAGQSDPTSEVVTKMANLFGVTADYLLGLSNNAIPEVSENNLSLREQTIILTLRRGDKLGAIRLIAAEE